jgi:alkylation response protein AidB-like acyl-CoA dehydrogenase
MTGHEPEVRQAEPAEPAVPEDDAIRAIVSRLARRHASGGVVIERAAILAEGTDCAAVVAWIAAHDGKPEEVVASTAPRGLHSARLSGSMGSAPRAPLRYILPAGVTAAAGIGGRTA